MYAFPFLTSSPTSHAGIERDAEMWMAFGLYSDRDTNLRFSFHDGRLGFGLRTQHTQNVKTHVYTLDMR